MQIAWILLLLLIPLSLSSSPTEAQAEEGQPTLVRLQQYRPIYFLFGKTDTKIQFSFKVQWIETLPVYFAYTQLMMWDVLKPSAPFRDLNYNPEVFYRWNIDHNASRWLDFGAFEHESNGRAGTASRSWNRLYLRFHSSLMSKNQSESKILWSIKAWLPFGYTHSTSGDIPRFRGLWEIQITITK